MRQVDSAGFGLGAAQEKNENHMLDGIREKAKTYEKRNLNIYTRTTIINTVFMAKLWYVAFVFDFTKRFYKEVDKIVFKFLWRSTEWLARNMVINARCHGHDLGVTHAQVKVKAIRLMQTLQVLKDPDKSSSVLARRWIGVRLREFFFVRPSRSVVFTLHSATVFIKRF